MCLVIVCPKGTNKYSDIVINAIRNSYETGNKDGFGFAAYGEKEKLLYVHKQFEGTVDEFLEVYKAYVLNEIDIVVIHLRNGNVGAKSIDNVHPFILSNDSKRVTQNDITVIQDSADAGLEVLMFHNGTFNGYGSEYAYHCPVDTCTSLHSDTVQVVTDMFGLPEIKALLDRDFKKFKKIFDLKIGANKLVFMTNSGNLYTTGLFIEDSGYSFSNASYKDKIVDKGGKQSIYPSRHFTEGDEQLTLTGDFDGLGLRSKVSSMMIAVIKHNANNFLLGQCSDLHIAQEAATTELMTAESCHLLEGQFILTLDGNASNFSGLKPNTLYIVEKVLRFNKESHAMVEFREFVGIDTCLTSRQMSLLSVSKFNHSVLIFTNNPTLVLDLRKLITRFCIMSKMSKSKYKKLTALYDRCKPKNKPALVCYLESKFEVKWEHLGLFLNWMKHRATISSKIAQEIEEATQEKPKKAVTEEEQIEQDADERYGNYMSNFSD